MILKAVKDHHKLIGTCLDTGHLIRMAQLGEKLDPAEQVKVMGDRNFGMHLKDHDNKRKTDVVFGDPAGVLDVAAVLKALREVKFKGPISIEYEANPNDPSPDMKKCVAYREGDGEEARLETAIAVLMYNAAYGHTHPRGTAAGVFVSLSCSPVRAGRP